jgi:hypothetical protein
MVLLVLVAVVGAAACGLAAYVTNTGTIARLQQAGFVAWSGSSIWADLQQVPWPGVSPGSSVWYQIQPGGRLSFAFTTMPLLRACGAAGVFLIGGGLCVSAVGRRVFVPPNVKNGAVYLGVFLCIAGVGAAFPSAASGFQIDASQYTITTGLQPGAPVAAFSRLYVFTPVAYGGLHTRTYHVEASSLHGPSIDLVALNYESEASALSMVLEAFVDGGGRQF